MPITSRVSILYPSEAYIFLNGQRRKAMTDQITTVAKTRLIRWYAGLRDTDLIEVARVLKLHLGL